MGVVLLVFLQLSCGINKYTVLSLLVGMGEDGAQSNRFLVVTGAGISGEVVWLVFPRVVD
jgi:hypothetical protein